MKLPKNYVPGHGVHKPTCYGGYGQRMLERMGWNKGQGLGREKGGMTEALEVKEKKDQLGVGANGGWDWTQKFWEEAYNSAAKNLDHETSSGSSSDTDAHAASTSSSDSDSDSDSDGGRGRGRRPAPRMHRDGVASSASEAELKIAAELSKDPWGRWGGRGGKMARIAAQEKEDAAKAAALLKPVSNGAASKGIKKAGKAEQAGAGEGAAEPTKRIVVTLSIKDDPTIKRNAFKPTPKTGWWGASYWVSAGALESLEEAAEHVARERREFNEDDQAALYMQVHQNARQGHKGLGKSTTVNVAGGKWEGTKKTFGEDEDEGDKADGGVQGEGAAAPQEVGDQGSGEAAGGEEAAGRDSKGNKKGKKEKKKKGEAEASGKEVGSEEEGGAKKKRKRSSKESDSKQTQEEEGEEEGSGKKSKAANKEQEQLADEEEAAAGSGTGKDVKWLKMAKVLLKQAPQRRLKLRHLCKQLLLQARDKHGEEGDWSHESISAVMHKKASKSKVVIQDKYVMLPTKSG